MWVINYVLFCWYYKFFIFFKVVVLEGCDYVLLEKKVIKLVKVIVIFFFSLFIVIDIIG